MRVVQIVLALGLATAFSWSAAADTPLARKMQESAEPLEGIETTFGELPVAHSMRLRSFLTRPEGSSARLPAVYFVQWLSCDTVEIGKSNGGWLQMMRKLVRESGMVVMRTDKAGVGDSEGGPCSALDYETELAHHRMALDALFAHPWVDPKRVFVFGASMGANFAPLVAADHDVRGIAVWGGGAQTWFERQLGFERRALELGGKDGATIDTRMRVLTGLYKTVLVPGTTYAQVLERDPELASAWKLMTGAEGDTQFGRPLAFHQQAQQRQWAAAWSATNTPVLALFGEFDWFEHADGVRLIGKLVNQRKAGLAQVHIVPQLDHHFTRYASPEDAFAERNGTPDATPVMDVLLPWLKQQAR